MKTVYVITRDEPLFSTSTPLCTYESYGAAVNRLYNIESIDNSNGMKYTYHIVPIAAYQE